MRLEFPLSRPRTESGMVDLWALRAQAVEPGACATPSMNLAHLIMVLFVDLFWDAEAIYGTTSKLRSSRRHSFCSDFDFGLSLQEGSPTRRKRTLRTCVRHRYADQETQGTAMGIRRSWHGPIAVWHAHPQVWHGLGPTPLSAVMNAAKRVGTM